MYSSRVYQRSERSGNDYQSGGGERGGDRSNDNNEKNSLRVDCSHIGRIIGQGKPIFSKINNLFSNKMGSLHSQKNAIFRPLFFPLTLARL